LEELSINISIAGRSYPLTVNPGEESAVRSAGKMIEEKLQFYQDQFNLKDKQDALALFALEIATEYHKLAGQRHVANDELSKQLIQIKSLLSEVKL
jgi:cell division protein ZapA